MLASLMSFLPGGKDPDTVPQPSALILVQVTETVIGLMVCGWPGGLGYRAGPATWCNATMKTKDLQLPPPLL